MRRLVEAQPGQDRRRARGGGIGADGDQAVMHFCRAMRFRPRFQFRQQRGAFRIGGQHGIEQAAIPARGLLRDMAKACARGQADLPAIGLDLPDDGLQQGGFPRAIAPDQPEPAPGVEGHVRAFQQGAAADAKCEIADGEHRHGGVVARQAAAA